MTEINLAVLNQIQHWIFIVSSFLEKKINGQIDTVVIQVTNQSIQIATCLKFIGTFVFHTSHAFDKFSMLNYKKSITGSHLILDNIIGVLDLKVNKTIDIDNHPLFIGTILDSEKITDTTPLPYDYYNVLKEKNHQHDTTYHTKTIS